MTSPDTEFISILGASGNTEAPSRVSSASLPEQLPILGLSDIVIFPGMVAPLLVETAQSTKLIDDVVGGDRLLGVVLQRNAEAENPLPHEMHEVGCAARVVLQFDEPWWNDTGTGPGFIHGPGESFPVWWTVPPREAPIITGWSGGPAAARLAGLPCADVVERALASLAAVFGRSVAELTPRMQQAYYHDWTGDPLARGGYSYGGVGAQAACELLRQPVENTLYLAGEALVEGRFGTVHAALADGRRAARMILGKKPT